MGIISKVDKATSLLRFVHRIKDILNKNQDFMEDTKDLDYKYFIKVVDEIGDEISKFTIGLQRGQMQISPSYKPDVIVTLVESAFFGIIKGQQTLEESYFAGEASIWTKDGNWTAHLPGIKKTFDKIEKATREELGEV